MEKTNPQLSKSAPAIKPEWCKGCQICVAMCPENVLAMIRAKAVVMHPEKCTGCLLCEIYCPDFAIEVEKSRG